MRLHLRNRETTRSGGIQQYLWDFPRLAFMVKIFNPIVVNHSLVKSMKTQVSGGTFPKSDVWKRRWSFSNFHCFREFLENHMILRSAVATFAT